MDLLNFEEQDNYEKELDRFERRNEIHAESDRRKKAINKWSTYKKLKFGRKPIG